VAGAALAALVVAVGFWYGSRGHDAPTVPKTAPSAPSTSEAADVEPTGCLGGDARDAAMVLAAQEAAPHTSNGAVDVAAALVRWSRRYPVPTPEEAKAVQAALIAPEAGYDLTAAFEGDPNLSSSLVPDGETFYVSTVPGVWNLESYSNDTARVSIGTGLVIKGELHPTFRLSTMYTLQWSEAGWVVVEANQPRPTEELFPIGTGFTEGC
jgi:hypothetical protein